MKKIDLENIREWYKTKLGITIPETEVIEIPPEIMPDNLHSSLFLVPPIRSWGEIDRESFENSKQGAFSRLYNDSDFSEVPKERLKSEFEDLIRKEITIYEDTARASSKLKNYIEQHRGERIYVCPGFSKLESLGLSEEDRIVVNSFLAHELLHREQERRDLNRKFPHIKEGPAWVLQLLYGTDAMGFDEYIKRHEDLTEKLNHQQDSQREERYGNNVVIGIEAVTKNLDIDLRGNPTEQLSRFRRIFEEQRCADLSSEVLYRYLKPKILDAFNK